MVTQFYYLKIVQHDITAISSMARLCPHGGDSSSVGSLELMQVVSSRTPVQGTGSECSSANAQSTAKIKTVHEFSICWIMDGYRDGISEFAPVPAEMGLPLICTVACYWFKMYQVYFHSDSLHFLKLNRRKAKPYTVHDVQVSRRAGSMYSDWGDALVTLLCLVSRPGAGWRLPWL